MNNIASLQGTQVKHGLLVQLTVNTTTYYLSNLYGTVTWNGNDYTALGHFLGVSSVQDDLKATNNSLQLSLSGIPNATGETEENWLNLILTTRVKGSLVKVYRAFFDINTNALLSDQVVLRFSGYISNYSLSDIVDQDSKLASNTIVCQCSNINAILERAVVGRRTNGIDQQRFYPGDTSMDNVLEISNKVFEFGKPYQGGGTSTPGGGGGGGGGGNDQTEVQLP